MRKSLDQFARERMVKELIVRGIVDNRVLAAMRKVPRHLFIDEGLKDTAYGDHALPIGEGQTISQPYIVALMSEALGLTGGEKSLEIGTGSGYQAAILAELSARVFSIDRLSPFVSKGWKTLDQLHYKNIVLRASDGTYGWREEAPFDAILVAAAAPSIPPPLVEQLKVGGRMVIPIGAIDSQVLYKVIREEDKTVMTPLVPCRFVPLLGAFAFPSKPPAAEETIKIPLFPPFSKGEKASNRC